MAQTVIVDLLSARGEQHGPFEKHAAFSQALKRAKLVSDRIGR